MMKPADRITRLPQQFFAGLVNLAVELKAQGRPVINLGQGNPDQPTPEPIVAALKRAADNPRYQRYIPFTGLPELKQAVARWYARRHGVTLDWKREVAILIGSKIGLQEISLAVLNPGDMALVPDPGYPDYWSGIRLAGGQMIPWPLSPDSWLPDVDFLTDQVRLAFLNYPNNPTGQLASASFLDRVIARAEATHTVIAHDLAYGDIVYDGQQAISLLARLGGKNVGIEFTTVSKSYNMAGFRLGFAAGHPDLIAYLETLQDHLNCSQYGAIQEAAITALDSPPESVAALRDLYQRRRDRFLTALSAAHWNQTPSQGSIFQWLTLPAGTSSVAFAEQLARHTAVIVAPGRGFGERGEGYIRVSLTENEDTLAHAAALLGQFVQRL
ncbi:LL-diaminopimelate aminotransferase [Sulfobacillus thermotolerans]|uniref:LL-diaminopimelate aminotransferase n=1 Tax=Sulfobacillus thermotolerans TaxID=338644 RepID=A0ABM6RUC5_9FIRM|nr:LL-diaminopimelate aminotransferase [Sulfobacillus thermotolerans]